MGCECDLGGFIGGHYDFSLGSGLCRVVEGKNFSI